MKFRLGLVTVQLLFVLALAGISARPIPLVFTRPLGAALFIWFAGLLFLLFRNLYQLARRQAPISQLPAALAAERPVIVKAFLWALVLGSAMAIHGWAKTMIPHVTGGFWADPMLADLDQRLFGQDPWPLFRIEALAPLYATAYVSWFFIIFSVMGLVVFSRKDHRAVLDTFLCLLIGAGTLGQYLLPSAGPMFYQRLGLGDRFAELVATNDPTYTLFADYLWTNYVSGGANLGTGISAMPSMHVSMSVWTVLAAWSLYRPLALPAALFALTVWAASIASGWHYALDGLAGGLLAVVFYALLSWRDRLRAAPAGRLIPLAVPAAA